MELVLYVRVVERIGSVWIRRLIGVDKVDSVICIRALGDNLIYLYPYGRGLAAVIDPGDGRAVLEAAERSGVRITTVLATHHHFDHVGGIAEVKEHTGCEVICGAGGSMGRRQPSLAQADRVVGDGDVIELGDESITVIATPGHTRDSVCYYLPAGGTHTGVVWTGDTLFVGGCGRIIECDAETMWDSLARLAELDGETSVYGGHDYIDENYRFALGIEPDNAAITKCLAQFRQTPATDKAAIRSTIERERGTNIFLRSGHGEVARGVGMEGLPAAKVFAELRRRKDAF